MKKRRRKTGKGLAAEAGFIDIYHWPVHYAAWAAVQAPVRGCSAAFSSCTRTVHYYAGGKL